MKQNLTFGLARFGLGQRLAETRHDEDPREVLLAELGAAQLPLAGEANLQSTPMLIAVLRSTRSLIRKARDEAIEARKKAEAGGDIPATRVAPGPTAGPAVPANPSGLIFYEEITARLQTAFQAPTGFVERLVWFWSNHFATSATKSQLNRILAGAFEREAIRPFVLGRFVDMLKAVERHPAMLIYLDNDHSIDPQSVAGARKGRGLNENLAREILELHTLGVRGGYTQADVTEFARAITGWTVNGIADPRKHAGFAFDPKRHANLPRRILGKTYAQSGEEQGEAILEDLALKPQTAEFIALKFARHFVSDAPSATLVKRLAERFIQTKGNLRNLAETLVSSNEAWNDGAQKFRSPIEFVMASHRAIGVEPSGPQVARMLLELGQPIWSPPGPNGYSDMTAQWMTPQGLQSRLLFATEMGRKHAARLGLALTREGGLAMRASRTTRDAIALAETREQAMTLLLMSPEFQWR